MARFVFRRSARFFPSLLLFLSLTLLFAAAPKPAKLTVVRLEGTSVVGELVEATPAGVTIKPVKGDPETVAWKDIKTVSNGLTRQKVVDDWKTTHADQLCETCHGLGQEKCPTCNGTGVDPAQAKECDKCKGTGDLGKCLKCTDGKVPCPATCLKPEMFAGLKVNEDGKKHKTFPNGQWYSEHHVGDLIVKEGREYVDKGKCPTCLGTSKVICPTCHGTAKRECPACHGAGVIGPACTAGCKAGLVECKTCGGTGLKAAAGADAVAPPVPSAGGQAADKP